MLVPGKTAAITTVLNNGQLAIMTQLRRGHDAVPAYHSEDVAGGGITHDSFAIGRPDTGLGCVLAGARDFGHKHHGRLF